MKDKTFPEVPETENQNEDPEVFAVQWQGGKVKISRRNLLKAGGVLAAGVALAECASEDASDWNCKKAFAHEHQISQLAITPDGQWALSIAEMEPSLKLWSFPKGKTLKLLERTIAVITSFAISPEGDYIYSVNDSGVVAVWTLPGAEEVNQFPVLNNLGKPLWLCLSPNGEYLGVTGQSETCAIYSVPDGTLLQTLEHESTTRGLSLKFSPDSQYLSSFDLLNGAIVWSLADGKPLVKRECSKPTLFSPDSKFCIMTLDNNTDFYSLPEGEHSHNLQGHHVPIAAQIVNSKTGELITGYEDSIVKIWSISDGSKMNSWFVNGFHDFYFCLNEEENLLAIVENNDSKVGIYSLIDGIEIATLEMESPSVIVEFSPNGKILALIEIDDDNQSKVRLYGIESEKILVELTFQGKVNVVFSPDNRFLLTGDEQGKMIVYSLEDGKEVSCMVDLAVNDEGIEGSEYSLEVEGETVTYTLPCGSPLPAGAVCVCDCVSGSACACVGHTTCSCVGDVCSCVSHSGGSHYWYPN